jgi:hypothetical protein
MYGHYPVVVSGGKGKGGEAGGANGGSSGGKGGKGGGQGRGHGKGAGRGRGRGGSAAAGGGGGRGGNWGNQLLASYYASNRANAVKHGHESHSGPKLGARTPEQEAEDRAYRISRCQGQLFSIQWAGGSSQTHHTL